MMDINFPERFFCMLSLHFSCLQVNETNVGKYFFYRKGDQIFAEKRGLWTLVKAHILPSRWVGDYMLGSVMDEIKRISIYPHSTQCMAKVLNKKMGRYHEGTCDSRRIQKLTSSSSLPQLIPAPSAVVLRNVNVSSLKQLTLLTQADVNRVYPLSECLVPQGIDHYAKGASFFSFDAEGIDDYGWGCAWRSIQTCMSSLPKEKRSSFLELYDRYGSEETLKEIYDSHHKNKLEREGERAFAPQDIESGWAEPFIGQLIFQDLGVDADLQFVNLLPVGHNSPRMVFPNNPIAFNDLKERLKAHFEKEPTFPVMIDNGTYAYAIVGYGEGENDRAHLWIADPHIEKRVNKGKSPDVGLFMIAFDKEGKGFSSSFVEESRHKMLLNGSSFDNLYRGFQTQGWMVLFPGEAQR